MIYLFLAFAAFALKALAAVFVDSRRDSRLGLALHVSAMSIVTFLLLRFLVWLA